MRSVCVCVHACVYSVAHLSPTHPHTHTHSRVRRFPPTALAPTSVAAAQSPRPDKAARAAAAAKEFPKKPKPSKSERRALQEKQRAEKAAKLDTDGKGSSSKGGAAVSGAPAPSGGGTIVVPGADAGQRGGKVAADDEKRNKERSKRLRKEGVPERASAKKQVQLFSHLHQYDCSVSLTSNIPFGASKVRPPPPGSDPASGDLVRNVQPGRGHSMPNLPTNHAVQSPVPC